MMEHVLMNFGDNARIVNTSNNVPVTIGIGEIVRADIHEVHAQMIQRALSTETMIVCDLEMAQSAPKKFGQVMAVLRDINQDDYDGLLERFNAINGPNPEELRPTRDMIRIALREIARQEVRKMMADRVMNNRRVVIHEQGDEVTRQDVPSPRPPEKTEDKPPTQTKKAAGNANKKAPKGQGKPKSKIKRERL